MTDANKAEEKPEEKKAEAAPSEAKPEEKKAAAPAAAPAAEKKAEDKPAAKADDGKKPWEAYIKDVETFSEDVKGKYFYPNKWGRSMLTAAEDIMGEKGVRSMLNLGKLEEYIGNYPPDNMKKEFPFEDVAATQEAIWQMYGKRGARVFAVRAGEATFLSGLAQFKSVATAAQVAMRVGNLQAKINIGLEFFSKFFNSVSDQKVVVTQDDEYWYWIITRNPLAWGRKSDDPVSYLAVGVLQGALGWVSEGKKWRIQQTLCTAKGDPIDVIAIEKTPVE